LPSIWLENNPLFGYEAMKGGRALLGARVGGIPDMIEDGVNGYLFQKGDAVAATAVLRKILENKNFQELGRNGNLKAKKEYSPEEHSGLLVEIFAGSNP
jgi:glycosyltransferase involved in cell wall biosynthesis